MDRDVLTDGYCRPLQGITVADFTGTLPGPLATAVLAQLGADVIKVEAPSRAESRATPSFRYLNDGKRSIVLNLKSAHGLAAAMAVVARSDVVVEGFRPGVMASFGLAYDDLAGARPDLVYCSLSGYGDTGPAAARPGHDINYLAAAGVLHRHRNLAGDLVEAPLPAPTVDIVGGLVAAIGMLAALAERQQTGVGRRVDARLAEGALLLGMLDLARYASEGVELIEPPGGGNPHYRLFHTSDGRAVSIGITPGETHFWEALCDATGLTSWRDVPYEERAERRVELETTLEAVFRTQPLARWCERLAGSNAAWAPVATAAEALVDEAFTRPRPGESGAPLPIGVRVQVGAPVGAAGADTLAVLRQLDCPDEVIVPCLADLGLDANMG